MQCEDKVSKALILQRVVKRSLCVSTSVFTPSGGFQYTRKIVYSVHSGFLLSLWEVDHTIDVEKVQVAGEVHLCLWKWGLKCGSRGRNNATMAGDHSDGKGR